MDLGVSLKHSGKDLTWMTYINVVLKCYYFNQEKPDDGVLCCLFQEIVLVIFRWFYSSLMFYSLFDQCPRVKGPKPVSLSPVNIPV